MMVVLGLSAQAGAQTQLEESAFQVEFGSRGHVTIDARPGNSLVPLHDDLLSFATWEEYLDFLSLLFNVEVIDTGDGLVPLVAVAVIGEPIGLTPTLDDLQPIQDPIATFIGGQKGLVEVAGTLYCLDGDRCADPVNPFSLMPVRGEVIEASELPSVAPSGWKQGFAIESTLAIKTQPFPQLPGNFTMRMFTSQVRQISGSFGYQVPVYSPIKPVCIPTPGWASSYPWSGQICFMTGGDLLGHLSGSNRLATEIYLFGYQQEPWRCEWGILHVPGLSERDVMRLTITYHAVEQFGRRLPGQRAYQPSEVFGFSMGEDYVLREQENKDLWLVTGFVPSCTP